MIDKVFLTTKDFKLKEGADFEVSPAKYNLKTAQVKNNFVLAETETGAFIDGSKAFHNSELCNVDINAQGLRIAFNPNKIINGIHNLYSVNYDEYRESLKQVETYCRYLFSADFGEMKVSRLDLNKDSSMRLPFYSYREVFQVMSAVRSKRVETAGNEYRIGNQRRQFAFYDKLAELKEKHSLFIKSDEHIMRAEVRLLKKDLIVDKAGIEKLSDLNQDCFGFLPDVYKQSMKEVLFKNVDSDFVKRKFQDDIELLKSFKEKSERSAFTDFICVKGAELLLCYGVEGIEILLKSAGFSRKAVYTNKQKFLGIIEKKRQIENKASESDVLSLYDEVYEKFCG